jgi:hypothetical protein
MKWWDNLKSGRMQIGNTTYHNVYSGLVPKIVLIIPLLLVNSVAIIGQMGFAADNLKQWGFFGQLLFAFSLESIAVYLSWHAMAAERRNDSAFRLVLMSYLMGLFVACINYSHYAKPLNKPNTIAIVVATMSMASPILWRIHSRAVSRSLLFQRNLIDEHMVRLGGTRWLWHPINSFKVTYHASWLNNEHKPINAIENWEDSVREKEREKALKQMTNSSQMNGEGHTTDIEKMVN